MGKLRDARIELLNKAQTEFETGLTPENAVEKLRQFSNHDDITYYVRTNSRTPVQKEWVLEAFQRAVNIVAEDRMLSLGQSLRNNFAFNTLAPSFYTVPRLTRGILPQLFDRCPAEQRPDMLLALEETGHIQGVMRHNVETRSMAPYFLYETVTGHLSPEHAQMFLKPTQTLQVAKQDPAFILKTIRDYPQYTDLVR